MGEITSQLYQYLGTTYTEDNYNYGYEPNTTWVPRRQQTIIYDNGGMWQPNTWEPYFPTREPDNTELLEQLLRMRNPVPEPKPEPVKIEPKPEPKPKPKNGRLEGLLETI